MIKVENGMVDIQCESIAAMAADTITAVYALYKQAKEKDVQRQLFSKFFETLFTSEPPACPGASADMLGAFQAALEEIYKVQKTPKSRWRMP